jgi:hypothetical protein
MEENKQTLFIFTFWLFVVILLIAIAYNFFLGKPLLDGHVYAAMGIVVSVATIHELFKRKKIRDALESDWVSFVRNELQGIDHSIEKLTEVLSKKKNGKKND